MQDVQRGYKEGIYAGIVGFVVQAVIVAFRDSSLIPSWYILIMYLVPLVGVVSDIAMITNFAWRKVGIGFGIGWWFGMGIMAYVGVMELWLFVLYLAITIAVVVLKAWSDHNNRRNDIYF